MGCFSCGESLNTNQRTILQAYKDNSLRTGKKYWFFQKEDSNEIQIMSDDDFKNFKKANSKDFTAGKYEFALIQEFRAT